MLELELQQHMLTRPRVVRFSQTCELLIFKPTIPPHKDVAVTEPISSSSSERTPPPGLSTFISTDKHHDTDSDTEETDDVSGDSDSCASYRYRIGDTLRSSQHIIEPKSFVEEESVTSLQLDDYAWIKRGNGDWTFCQLVERSDNIDGEDVMTFRVSERGHRKSLRPRRWMKKVRKCSERVKSNYVERGWPPALPATVYTK
jgi:hypothetical protein